MIAYLILLVFAAGIITANDDCDLICKEDYWNCDNDDCECLYERFQCDAKYGCFDISEQVFLKRSCSFNKCDWCENPEGRSMSAQWIITICIIILAVVVWILKIYRRYWRKGR